MTGGALSALSPKEAWLVVPVHGVLDFDVSFCWFQTMAASLRVPELRPSVLRVRASSGRSNRELLPTKTERRQRLVESRVLLIRCQTLSCSSSVKSPK